MADDKTHERELLGSTVRSFMEQEMHPHEELVACRPDAAFRTLADAGELVKRWIG